MHSDRSQLGTVNMILTTLTECVCCHDTVSTSNTIAAPSSSQTRSLTSSRWRSGPGGRWGGRKPPLHWISIITHQRPHEFPRSPKIFPNKRPLAHLNFRFPMTRPELMELSHTTFRSFVRTCASTRCLPGRPLASSGIQHQVPSQDAS